MEEAPFSLDALMERMPLIATILIMMVVTYMLCFYNPGRRKAKSTDASEPLHWSKPKRKFTREQLKEFDGEKNPEILIAISGLVFDVSHRADIYGPGKSYSMFAGQDATRAMAKFNFAPEMFADPRTDDLDAFEMSQIQNWLDKYQYDKGYEIIGLLEDAKQYGELTKDELKETMNTILQEAEAKKKKKEEEEDADADNEEEKEEDSYWKEPEHHYPMLLGVRTTIFDVSFGGFEMYKEGSPYFNLLGKDASYALGAMKLEPKDMDKGLEGIQNFEPANEEEEEMKAKWLKTLEEWEVKLRDSRKYPVVGTLIH